MKRVEGVLVFENDAVRDREPRTRPRLGTADYSRNADRTMMCMDEGSEVCARCGREVKNPKFWVHEIDGGGTILHPEDEALYDNPSADLGLVAVGPECAKHFKGWLHIDS